MSISLLAKRHFRLVSLVLVVLIAYGVVSCFQLPAREDPEITVREAVITTHYPGLSPSRVERLITRSIERATRRVEEVQEIRSFSRAGISTVHVKVADTYFELDQIWDELRKELVIASGELPEGTAPPVLNDDFGDVAVVTVALRGKDFTAAERNDIAAFVQDELYAIKGTRRVELYGAEAERVFIEVDFERLDELKITPGDLTDALRGQNIIRSGGEVDSGARAFLLEPSGDFESLEALEETLVRVPQRGVLVPLRDVARVRRGTADPPQQVAYFDGQEAIVFALSMLPTESALDYGERALAALDEIRAALPVGYELDVVTYQPTQVERALFGVTENVFQTLAIVLAVVILFLGIRTGLIVGAIVPAVMLVTLAIMGVCSMTLERMSLATLVIALGLLVDNGIVVVEDFKRRLEDGVDRDSALDQVGRELALPLFTSTLTTVLVFMPLMLADDVSGEYTRSISLVILITLLSSWVLAMTVTPVLCHRFIRVEPRRSGRATAGKFNADRLFEPINRLYRAALRRTLGRPLRFLASMVVLLAAALAAIAYVPERFFPDSDRAQVIVYVDLPPGVSARSTQRAMRGLFEVLEDGARFPHVQHHAGYVGFGGPRFVLSLTPIDPAPNRGFVVLDVDDGSHVDETIEAARVAFAEALPWGSVRVSRMFLGPSDSTKLEIQVKGPDAEVLVGAAEQVERVLARVPGAIDPWNDWEGRIAKLRVQVDQRRAGRAGVSSAEVAAGLTTHYSGNVVTEFREGDGIFPVVVRAAAATRGDLEGMESLRIVGATGSTVPLGQVADLAVDADFAVIAREDLVRTITLSTRSTQLSAEDMVSLVRDDLTSIQRQLPPGHAIEIDGVVQESREGQSALAANVPACIGLMVLLLVAQFNSFKRPLIIMVTIPLVMIGVCLGLHLMRADFGFMVILGIYSLAGIVINNAIVLIDRMDLERNEASGETCSTEALISACVRRLRPITMTTVTTVIGLLPLIVSRDPLFYGMASAIAFGLMIGTILTLGVVPVLYFLFLVDRRSVA